MPIVGDIRDETVVADAVGATVERFGGIDVCVNNASAINLSGTEALEMKRYDLMQDINTRGTFVVTRACVPHLKRAPNPHILTLSPPISLEPRWLGPLVAYTIAKYGMSLCALGFAEEFRDAGIASNAEAAVAWRPLGLREAGRIALPRPPRGQRGHHTTQPRVHRQHAPMRGRARRGGRHRLRRLRLRPRSDAAGGYVRRPRLTMTISSSPYSPTRSRSRCTPRWPRSTGRPSASARRCCCTAIWSTPASRRASSYSPPSRRRQPASRSS